MTGNKKASIHAGLPILLISIAALIVHKPYIIIFLTILTTVIVIHEFGHFVAAKIFGVEVNQFAIGFGPILLNHTIKETDYQFRIFPIGGFIDPNNKQMNKLSTFKNITVSLAGPLANITTAWIGGTIYYLFSGRNIQLAIENSSIVIYRMTSQIFFSLSSLFQDSIKVFETAFGQENSTPFFTSTTGSEFLQSSVEQGGNVQFISLFAAISVSLGLLNLLPLPPLDGFQIFAKITDNLTEKIGFTFSKTKFIKYVSYTSLTYLMLFQIAVFWLDIKKIPFEWVAVLIAVFLTGKQLERILVKHKSISF